MKKRIIALMLSIIMTLCLLPMSVFADGGEASTEECEFRTMHICFADEDTGTKLKISDIFDNSSYIALKNDEAKFIAEDYIDGRKATNAFTVANDAELIFTNVPLLKSSIKKINKVYGYSDYSLGFDLAEMWWDIPETYRIMWDDIVEDENGDMQTTVMLSRSLIVGDVGVTKMNAADILGDGTATYDIENKVLTLTNANITAKNPVKTGLDKLSIVIPEGTTSALTVAPYPDWKERPCYNEAVYTDGELSISGGGTLEIDAEVEDTKSSPFAIYSRGNTDITNVMINMPSSLVYGVKSSNGNLSLDGATIVVADGTYGKMLTANGITIETSKIDLKSSGSNMIWTHGGNIRISDSTLDLVCDIDPTTYIYGSIYYAIFAEVGTIDVSGKTSITITTNKTDAATDGEIFVATNGITLSENLTLSDGTNACEIYEGSQYSVRYTDGSGYPTKIVIQDTTAESGSVDFTELNWLWSSLSYLGNVFADVTSTDWFDADVKYAYENGLMTGTAEGTFSPYAPVTRGMVMTILARYDGVKTDRYSPWYAAGVEWAVQHGISDGTNPEAPITREQLAAMLYRYAQLKGYDLSGAALNGFADADSVSDYARTSMQWAIASGILTGSEGKLNPSSTATRAQLAAMLHRLFG